MTEFVSLLGAHTSIAGGLQNALLEGQAIGATTVQIFTSNQRRWAGTVIAPEKIALWEKTLSETGLKSIMSHGSYLINLGASNPEILQKSQQAFEEEIQRCLDLNLTFLNFHPGAAVGGNVEECLNRITESLLKYEKLLAGSSLTLLLETTAGQGSCVGANFEELGIIIKAVKDTIPIGVCIDTCHIFAAGYDIRTAEGWDKTLKQFNQLIGLNHLYAFHLNDSMKPFASKRDRHSPLGKGEIGLPCFEFLMNDSRTRHLPKYLETPDGPPLWKQEIALLHEMAK